MQRHARYGPPERYQTVPAAGMCLSAFALVKRGGRFLIGTPVRHEVWAARWLFSWATYSKQELEEASGTKLIPSTYLLEGEHPKHAISRIMRQQLRMPHYVASLRGVVSYSEPSSWYPGNNHWDLAFVYDVETRDPLGKHSWWSELGFVKGSSLRPSDFGWNSDLVVDLGVVSPEPETGQKKRK